MLRRLIEKNFKIKIIIKSERRSNMKENKNTVLPCYDNRELSWLKFNERVLEEAEDERVPLCERLTFVNIFWTNLDEFFRVRVGSIYDQMLISDKKRENKTYMTSSEQLESIYKNTKELLKKKERRYACLLIQSHYGYFICIPYRTEISHKYAYHFRKSSRSQKHRSGLDYTKIAIIKDIS